jgi:hypothetical protein
MTKKLIQLRMGLLATAVLVLAGTVGAPNAAADDANTNRKNVLFTQQDQVMAFDFHTGQGYQVGTVTGAISGTSIVNFQFIPTGAATFNFVNKVVITDLDGDQLLINNVGTGRFIAPIDPSIFALGGPLVGTYQVTGGTGKYVRWIGSRFPYRAVASNPSSGNNLGSVMVEVLSNQ